MLSIIDKQMLGAKGSWNHKSQVLTPSKLKFDRSVVLIHGFMGSPFDMKTLGFYLAHKGFKVIIPVIPGQTFKTPLKQRQAFSKAFYIHWLKDIIDKETVLRGCRPYLVGFSMGGTISTIVAAQGLVEKLVLVAPFYKLPHMEDIVWKISRKMAVVLPYLPKLSKGRINRAQGYKRYVPGSYFVSVKAFNHLGDLAREARKAAGNIHVPTRVYLSDNDQVADSKMTQTLFEGKSNIDLVFENRANHILLYDYGADELIARIGAFLTLKE